MASSTSSQPRTAASPSPSFQPKGVDRLIQHLLASKRSLSSIHHVHRATEILTLSRNAVESTTVLNARTTYLQRSLTSQLKILRGVQFELEENANSTQKEFNWVLKELDASHRRLEEAVQVLTDTKVQDGFRAGARSSADSEEETDTKETLHDFVDDKPVDELREMMKAAISNVQDAKQNIDQSIKTFEDDLQNVNDALAGKTISSSSAGSELQQPNIPVLLDSLEEHAREMAVSLESLVKHFDLCVTAIKHTEGGGAAVAQNLSVGDLPEGIGEEAFEKPAQPISEPERDEMMGVLENDAAELDDVVMEIQSRNADMESSLEQVESWQNRKQQRYEEVLGAFKLLEQDSGKLPGYVSQSAAYSLQWREEKTKIEDGMAGLEELRDVYENFLRGYDGLLVEVARRRSVRTHMEKVVKDAQARLEQLYEDDLADRNAFHEEQGDYLPSDIWSGLADPPPKYSIMRAEDGGQSLPDLPRKTVEEALKRLKAGR